MEFTVYVDGIKFIANKEDIDELIDDVVFEYSLVDRTYNTQLVCDSKEVIDYFLKEFLEKRNDFEVYDFSENKTTSLLSFYELIENNKPLIAKGMEEYTDYLQETQYKNNKELVYSRMIDEAKIRLYHDCINFRRDSIFNEYNSKIIFVFSDDECTIFNITAMDFCSQYSKMFDFNKAFKPEKQLGYTDLSDYILNKRLGLKKYKKTLNHKKDETN